MYTLPNRIDINTTRVLYGTCYTACMGMDDQLSLLLDNCLCSLLAVYVKI